MMCSDQTQRSLDPPPNEIDMDVTDTLQTGKANTIAIRVNTGLNAAGQSGGFYSRVFLYAPKPGT